MPSASQHPQVVTDYLQSEMQDGRLLGPFHPSASFIQTSPFGVIPKRSKPGKWRLITDLSSPQGSSVNDGIDPGLCSVHYSGLDEAITMVRRFGRGCLLAKIDLKNAYRIIPVHPDDRPLLGVNWKDEVFLDAALPFGLRSAPKIFSTVANTLLWILAQAGMYSGFLIKCVYGTYTRYINLHYMAICIVTFPIQFQKTADTHTEQQHK